ncbi:MAG TPA: hypothetical protein VF666_21700 [Pyrinomonadaceae bacterium]|jgi:hypothetical protein
MKFKVLIVLMLVAVAWVVGRNVHVNHSDVFESDGREEIRRSFQLEPGAEVEVRGINGSVDVATAEGNAAEVHIVRTAENKSDLDKQKIVIEQTPTSLTIYGKNRGSSWWKFWQHGEVRQQITLKLPRSIEFNAKGINGGVKVGELDGGLQVSGVNGRVEVAQFTGYGEVSGVNGRVSIGVARLSEQGISVKGINGGVELRLPADTNADLNIKGHNGGVSNNLSNLTEQERTHSSMRARIGTGGAEISLTGINGGVQLEPAATTTTTGTN